MDCRVLKAITLKSDGHVSCDDSNGYQTNLAHVTAQPGWRIRAMLTGPIYAHVRSSFAAGRVPWPGVCETCDLFSANAPLNDTLDRQIDVRVEPTLACNLRCPSCKRGSEARQRTSDDWMLDPGVLRQLLGECVREGIAVKTISYLGWGEPLEHPAFDALVQVGREQVPSATHELTTVGNAEYRAALKDAWVERIIVSCDGVTQEKYERYRRGGDMAAAHRFLRDAKLHAPKQTFVEWKYILFDHNDSDAEVREAQRIADDCGVDSLLFIVTNSKGGSQRFNLANLGSFPLVSPRATISPAAALQKVEAQALLVRGRSKLGRGAQAHCYVDKAELTSSGILVLQGWALTLEGRHVERIDFFVGSEKVGSTTTVHPRADVLRAYPHAESDRCGYVARMPGTRITPSAVVDLDVHSAQGVERFQAAFVFG